MSELAQFTTKFRIQKTSNSTAPEKAATKRVRLACVPCQKSKLKCDRAEPCGSCVKRDADGAGAACTYQSPRPQIGVKVNVVAEDRLKHLEAMVNQLMESQRRDNHIRVFPAVTLQSSESVPLVEAGDGTIDSTNLPTYVGSTHWSAILDDIQELKLSLGEGGRGQQGPAIELSAHTTVAVLDSTFPNELIFGSADQFCLQDIITQYLPSKIQIDRLLATFFTGRTYILPFIHAYQFQRQYKKFWENASGVNPLWLSILLSLCCMGSLVGEVASNPSDKIENDFSSLHTGAAKCLVLGKYHRPQKFALEALGLYCHCKNLKTLDPSREVGAIVSMLVRMAYEMGYHRDPSTLGSFTVFEGEMRRRLWASCHQMDTMISFQLGLPSSINLETCDTQSPRHLVDSDFDEDCQVLPPSRSENEATRLLWFIVKERQMVSFSKVCRDALSLHEKTDEEIMQLDREVREMQASIPEILRANPLADSLADPAFLIVTRLYVDFISLKSLCVLHRKYMARGNVWSTKCCIEAGTTLVAKFVEMYDEFLPGGQLSGNRWMLTNFTFNDFMMGTMLLCLIVHTRWKKKMPDEVIDAAVERQVLKLLERSYDICVEQSVASRDAKRVSSAILHTLNRSKTEVNISNEEMPVVIDPSNLLLPPWYGYLQGDEAAFGLLDPYNFGDGGDETLDWSIFHPRVGLGG